MGEAKRTPGQAEGTEKDVQSALDENQQRRQGERAQQPEDLNREPGRTPEQAEGTEEQADDALRHKK